LSDDVSVITDGSEAVSGLSIKVKKGEIVTSSAPTARQVDHHRGRSRASGDFERHDEFAGEDISKLRAELPGRPRISQAGGGGFRRHDGDDDLALFDLMDSPDTASIRRNGRTRRSAQAASSSGTPR